MPARTSLIVHQAPSFAAPVEQHAEGLVARFRCEPISVNTGRRFELVRDQAFQREAPRGCELKKKRIDSSLRPSTAVMMIVSGDHGESSGHEVGRQALLPRITGVAQHNDLAE